MRRIGPGEAQAPSGQNRMAYVCAGALNRPFHDVLRCSVGACRSATPPPCDARRTHTVGFLRTVIFFRGGTGLKVTEDTQAQPRSLVVHQVEFPTVQVKYVSNYIDLLT